MPTTPLDTPIGFFDPRLMNDGAFKNRNNNERLHHLKPRFQIARVWLATSWSLNQSLNSCQVNPINATVPLKSKLC